jgi:beta-lactamase class C
VTCLAGATRRSALAALLCSLAPLSARAAGAGAGAAAAVPGIVDAAFEPLLREHGIPGLAVGVTFQGRRHVACYGLASREDGRPVTPETLFEIGSLSKTFTATLGGVAVARGAASLQDSPARFLPALQGAPIARANLLQLATYTAGGLPLQFPDAVTDAGLLDYFRQWQPAAAPGRLRQYSNPSIGLFGLACARALGGDFAQLLERELFPRLGLRHTYVQVPAGETDAYAWGYGASGQRMHVNPGVLDAQAYGVKTTVGDLLRFVEANLDPAAVEAPLRAAIAATHVGHFAVPPLVQGLGWEQYPFPVPLDRLLAGNASAMALEPHAATALDASRDASAPTLFNKTGSTNGFGAYAVFVPARRLGLVMLANRNIPNAARVRAGHAVLERLAALPA